MKNVTIGLVVAIAVVALVVFIYTGIRAVTDLARAISDDVIVRYVGLIKSGKYEEAYDGCLSDGYKKETTRSAFVAAHTAHTEAYGALEGWKQTDYQHEANLFTSESLIGINAILSYENRDVFVLYKVDSAVVPYRIREILGSAGTSGPIRSWWVESRTKKGMPQIR